MKKRIFIVFILLNLLNVSAQDSEISDIYDLIIEHSLKSGPKKIKKSKEIAILDSTIPLTNHKWLLDDYEYLLFKLPKGEEENIKNLLTVLISDSLCLPVDVKKINIKQKKRPISQVDFNEFFKETPNKGWNNFYKKFKKSVGIIKLSNIKHNGSYALVYVDYSYNGLGASGDLYLLEFYNGSWIFYSKTNVYQS